MKTFKTILFFAVITIFCSCENFDWFKTDKGLKKDIQGTWKREFLTNSDYEEDWNFMDGKLTILRLKNNAYDTIDKAEYTADAKMTVSYLKISGLTKDTTLLQYNNKWTIVQLDSKVLYLATDYSGGGVLQREFEKK
jgi:hypothetical protein